MKLLYVGDNRSRPNWGCRGTSIALGSLLREEHEVTGVIGGEEIGCMPSYIPWDGMAPVAFWRAVDAMPSSLFQKVIRRIKRVGGIRDDFIRMDPGESVERFHRLRTRLPNLQEMYRKVASAQAVVINGEGRYIFSVPSRRDTLYFNFILKLAQQLGKKTYVLNAMFSDCPKTGRNVETFEQSLRLLGACDAVSVRDPHSYEIMREAGLSRLHFNPDALFTWFDPIQKWKECIHGKLSAFEPFGEETHETLPEVDFDRPYICLSGSSSAAWRQREASIAYSGLARALSTLGVQVLLTPTCAGDRFMPEMARELRLPILPTRVPIRLGAAIAAKAEVWVSGRFHPSILASCGGTPCVFLGANSHKTLSLQSVLNYEHPQEFTDIPSQKDIEAIVARVKELLENPQREKYLRVASQRAGEARCILSLLH